MTPADAAKFLTAARLLDNRVGESDRARCVMWAEVLEDVPLPGAMAALKEHYKSSAETINPGHIRPLMRRVKAGWEDQLRSERAKLPAAPVEPVVISESTRAEIAALRAKLRPSRPAALKIGGSIGSGRGSSGRSASVDLSGPSGPSSFRSLVGPVVDAMTE